MKKRRYSLSMHIGSLFLLITSLVGLVLIYVSYQHAQELLDETAKQLSYENSRKIESEYKQNIGPILTTLDFLAYSAFTDKSSPLLSDKRLLSSTTSVFRNNEHLVALYFADESGEFTILRPLFRPEDKKRFNAPKNAILYVNKTQVNGKNEIFYLDSRFRQTGYLQSDDNQFDPRQRPWYVLAADDGKIRLTEPYFFYFLKTHGITLSRKTPNGKYVIGADFTLESLSGQIQHIGFSPQTQLILFDQQYNVLGQHNAPVSTGASIHENRIQLRQSVFASVVNRMSTQVIYENVTDDKQEWSVTLTPVVLTPHVTLMLAEATPKKDLLAPLLSLRNKQIIITVTLLAGGFVLAFIIALRLTQPLTTLVTLTNNITQFKFKKAHYPNSAIKEIANLSQSLRLMENTLNDILKLLKETASNHDLYTLAKTMTHQSYLVTRAETVNFYAFSAESQTFSELASHAIIPFKVDINLLLKETPWIKSQLQRGETVHIQRSDNMIKKHIDNIYNSDIYLFPLMNHHHQITGILNIGYERKISREQSDKHAFLKELLSFAQIAKENIDHVQQQKAMFNSLIESVASAIDTKSPYGNGNCQRIPTLVKWLTEAADHDQRYYPYFKMDELQWEALHLAAWLHDCGKITTPEYLINKATKLETVYDRIHEIRMRFELLKTQAVADYWQGIAEGKDPQALQTELETIHQTLDNEFMFVAQCNTGFSPVGEAEKLKLRQIAQRTWIRTLDDQAGVSWLEKKRAGKAAPLPVTEHLLDDKPAHKIIWDKDIIDTQNPGQPQQQALYDRGELCNLSVTTGTLTSEERAIINNYINKTRDMLKQISYPEHMKHVPDIAANHCERVDGQGYPRALKAEELSIQDRVMAIADIFEALTSGDKPYKKAKTLAESIQVMTEMATTGYLDPRLYLLFLEKDIYQQYADIFLDLDQCSPIDKQAHVTQVKQYLKTQL